MMNAITQSHYIGVDMANGQDQSVMTRFQRCKSNGSFALITKPYEKKQHPNQQGGLDLYVDVLDHYTGNINSVKLYENKRGLHFKKSGTHYLDDFTKDAVYVPYQTKILYDVQTAVGHINCIAVALDCIVDTSRVTISEVPHADELSVDESAMTRLAFSGGMPLMAYLKNTLVQRYTFALTGNNKDIRINIELSTGALTAYSVSTNRWYQLDVLANAPDSALLPALVRTINDIDEEAIRDDVFSVHGDKAYIE